MLVDAWGIYSISIAQPYKDPISSMSNGGSPCWALCHWKSHSVCEQLKLSQHIVDEAFPVFITPAISIVLLFAQSRLRSGSHNTSFSDRIWFWPLEATYPRTSVYMYSEPAHSLLALGTRTVDPWIRHHAICWLINNSILSVCKHVWIQSHPHPPPPSLLLTKCVLCPWARFSLCLWFYYVLIGFALVSSQTAAALVHCWYPWTHTGCKPLWITMSELLLYACDLSLNSWRIVCLCVWGHPWSLSLQAARRIKGMDLIRRKRACREVNG